MSGNALGVHEPSPPKRQSTSLATEQLVIYTLDPASREVHTMKQCEVEGLCFLATITSIHTGKRNRAVIIRCAYELNYFLHAATDVEVEGVQMLCPPTVTGRDLWSLEELLQIVFFRGVETEESAVVYRTSIGTAVAGTECNTVIELKWAHRAA